MAPTHPPEGGVSRREYYTKKRRVNTRCFWDVRSYRAKCGDGIWLDAADSNGEMAESIEDLARQVFAACAEAGDRCVRTVRIVERDPRVNETHAA